MNDRRTTLTDRIAFAEGWLDRARQQLEDGQVAHGALTLMLAEAELQRARESRLPTALAAARRRPRTHLWHSPVALVLATAMAVVGAVALAPLRAQPAADARDGGPVIVRLSGSSGEMLRMVTAPEPAPEPLVVERTVIKSVVVRVPVGEATRSTPPAAPAVAHPTAVSPAPQPAAVVPPPAVPASISVTPPAPTLLSEADVIDLVLAAERSLRRSANQ